MLDDFLFHFLSWNYKVTTLTCMDDQQQYQINFSIPESLGCETMCFLELTQHEAIVNEEILRNSRTSVNFHKHSNMHNSLYNSSLEPPSKNWSLFDIFS